MGRTVIVRCLLLEESESPSMSARGRTSPSEQAQYSHITEQTYYTTMLLTLNIIILPYDNMPQVTITIPSELLKVARRIQAKASKVIGGDYVPRSTAIQIALLAFDEKTVDLTALVKANFKFDRRRKKS